MYMYFHAHRANSNYCCCADVVRCDGNRSKLGSWCCNSFCVSLQSFFEGQSASWDAAKKEPNRTKNRYGNIIACKSVGYSLIRFISVSKHSPLDGFVVNKGPFGKHLLLFRKPACAGALKMSRRSRTSHISPQHLKILYCAIKTEACFSTISFNWTHFLPFSILH